MPIAASSLPPNFLQFLRQPTILSVAISLGMHGLVGIPSAIVPLVDSTAATGPLTVGVLQLTPEELSRLPQDATAFFNPTQSPLTPTTNVPGLGPESSLPLIPALPPLPPPPADIFSQVPSLDFPTPVPSLPSAQETYERDRQKDFPPPPPDIDGLRPPLPLDIDGLRPPLPLDIDGLRPPLPLDIVGNDPPPPNLSPPANSSDFEEDKQNPGDLSYEKVEDGIRNVVSNNAGILPSKVILEFPYPKSACPQQGYVAAIAYVDAQGQVTRAEITESSDVADFDEIALKTIAEHPYQASQDGQPKAYWTPFDFDPKVACSRQSTPDPTLPPSTKPSKPAITTSPSSSPTSSAKPDPSSSATVTPDPEGSQPGEKPEEKPGEKPEEDSATSSTSTSEPAAP